MSEIRMRGCRPVSHITSFREVYCIILLRVRADLPRHVFRILVSTSGPLFSAQRANLLILWSHPFAENIRSKSTEAVIDQEGERTAKQGMEILTPTGARIWAGNVAILSPTNRVLLQIVA